MKNPECDQNLTKWPEKSTTSYDMLDFESDIENVLREISGN